MKQAQNEKIKLQEKSLSGTEVTSGHDGGSDGSHRGSVPTLLLIAGSPLHACAPGLPRHHRSAHVLR